MRKLWFITLSLIAIDSYAQGISVQKNRYGMPLNKSGENCIIEKYNKMNELIDLSAITDICIPYTYMPDKIQDSDYSACESKTYTFKEYETHSLSMIVSRPKSKSKKPYPFIIYVHGGAWIVGSPKNWKPQSQYLASRGIVGISISYTLSRKGGNYEMGLQDIKDAYEFIKSHADEWNLDMNNYGFAGGSAGAPLAAHWAMKLNGCKLFIGCNGIYDFVNEDLLKGGLTSMLDKHPYFKNINTDDKRKDISPIFHIPLDNPPAVFITHGTADIVVPLKQSISFAQAVESRGGKVIKYIYPYYVHGFFNKNMSDKYEEVTINMYEFAKEIFQTE